MWLDAGYVEEQYFAVELDTLEHVQRQGDDRGDPAHRNPEASASVLLRLRWFFSSPIGAKRTVGTRDPKISKMCCKNTSGYNRLPGAPLKGGFYVAQIIMWSSSFFQPYFSISPVFCAT